MTTPAPSVAILPGLAGAASATGTVIVIDVFRAFTVAPLVLERGGGPIFPVAEIEDALALRDQYPDAVLIGERHGKKLEGFDFGNSPGEIIRSRIAGRPVIHTTHAGTRGLWAVARNGKQVAAIYPTSFINVDATIHAVRASCPTSVSIVPLGWAGETATKEDSLCAQYLAAHLTRPREAPVWTPADVVARLRDEASSRRFFDPRQPWSPESDFHLCCEINRCKRALVFRRDDTTGQGIVTYA